MSIEEMFQAFNEALTEQLRQHAAAIGERREQVLKQFAAACRRVDEDPRERQRIADIADLIDAEDALYEEVVAAVERGDHDRALPLLRRAAEAGIGEAAWLLADVLEERGETAEAITWYERAAADGDSRADAKLAELYSRPAGLRIFISHNRSWGNTSEHPPAKPVGHDYEGLKTLAVGGVSAVGSGPASWSSWLRRLQMGADFLYWAGRPLSAAPSADPWQVLKTPHHGASAEDLFRLDRWDGKVRILFVEGPTDEAVVRHWLTEYPYSPPRVVVLGSSRGLADTGADLTYELDDQVYTCQIKLLKYLRHGLSRTLAAPVPSWQVERRAAPEPTAGEVMTPLASLTTLAPAATVHQAVEQMLQASAYALPVCDEDQLVGVVTLADLARRIQDSRGVLSIERIQTLMHSPVALGMTASLSMVRALMAREPAGLITVTGPGGMIVGCITAQSLLADETGRRDTARPEEPSTLVPLLRPAGAR